MAQTLDKIKAPVIPSVLFYSSQHFLSTLRIKYKSCLAATGCWTDSHKHRTSNMGKIIFYEDRNFQGRSYETSSDCSDMSSYLSRCHSCRVESGCFMVYERPNYMGNQYFMRRGEYSDYMSFGMSDSIRSCRLVPQHRGQFRMRIYEKENFQGQSHELMDDCDNIQDRYRMSDCQSANVMDGHWLMYEQAQYRGRMMYMRPGEYRSLRDVGYSGMRLSSVRRIMNSC
ncbi:gamma-crystallin M3-like [Brachyistius frenatus]|uniref:gamma-crystallin M3-like n=1 Tax=Brachyistius frenatus TaxID=100188 RepID=UPI0037E9411B